MTEEMSMRPDVRNKVYWVVGLARSGCAAGDLLRRHGATVIGIDDADEVTVRRRWETEGLTNLAPRAFDELATGGNWPHELPEAVVISPGVPPVHTRLRSLPAEVEVLGELELGARFCAADLIAITGTNGKSTTTELVAHLARRAGRRAEALGNVGRPLCRVADELPREAVAVLEVSSFQLETVRLMRPQVGVVLNLAPDHLDRYPDLESYYAAKRVLPRLLPADGTYVTWTECPEARAWPTAARHLLFGAAQDGAEVYYRQQQLVAALNGTEGPLLGQDELALQSPPNLTNALAATATGLAYGLDPEAVADGLRDFPGLAHRHQLVGVRGEVHFIDDTKATNVHSVCAGLIGYPRPVVLIAGGSGKGEDYGPLRQAMDAVRHVVLLGQEGPAIGRAVEDLVPCSVAATMSEAVARAADLAEPDGVVLLSPACASFDMFANYRARGLAFADAALQVGAAPPPVAIRE